MGEFGIGILLIIGAFTGFTAFFGGLMNWNDMMAGSTSTNPLLFVAAVALIWAGRWRGTSARHCAEIKRSARMV